jgi:hypothetical protein
LAIKSGNYQWILDVFEKHAEQFPVAVFQGYPGMAYAYALACRTREDVEKDKVSSPCCTGRTLAVQCTMTRADGIGSDEK